MYGTFHAGCEEIKGEEDALLLESQGASRMNAFWGAGEDGSEGNNVTRWQG